MAWTVDQSASAPSALVAGTAGVTFTNATPTVVTYTSHGMATGDAITFSGTMPTGVNAGQTYYVNVINANTFNIALTPGGSNIATTSTGTVTAYPEKQLGVDCTTNATYVVLIDTSNIVNGDILELRLYTDMFSGGQELMVWKAAWQHAQIEPIKISPPIASDVAFKVGLMQTAGTGRVVPWKILRA
jgi:hypothetical protein